MKSVEVRPTRCPICGRRTCYDRNLSREFRSGFRCRRQLFPRGVCQTVFITALFDLIASGCCARTQCQAALFSLLITMSSHGPRDRARQRVEYLLAQLSLPARAVAAPIRIILPPGARHIRFRISAISFVIR